MILLFRKSAVTVLMAMAVMPLCGQTLDSDPIVKTMQEEISFTMDQLKAKPVPAYFMSLRLVDDQELSFQSKFGLTCVYNNHRRYVVPMIRVGNMELDNYKFNKEQPSDEDGAPVPLTDKPLCTYRDEIWTECLSRYNTAVNEYHDAVARTKTDAATEDKAPCFSPAPVEKYYEKSLPAMKIDTLAWKNMISRVTKVFKDCKVLEDGGLLCNFSTERKYFTNSEGTAVVQNRRTVTLHIQASIKASDGMVCSLYNSYFGFSEKEMPNEEKLIADAKDLIKRLVALRDAPLADPYTGPAILSGQASGVLFHEIFGHRLESHRAKMDGQTFKKMMNDRVLPEAFNVYSDPTICYLNGKPLNGSYLYDDEGVKSRRVDNVKKGILTSFLCSRIPVDGFLESNGHGRASYGMDPVARQSNLIIETERPYTNAELRDMLIKEAKRQGKEYGYYFRTVSGGFTNMVNLNMFNVSPLEVYRVYVDGRKDELVRAVDLIGTPLSVFSSIEAAGNNPDIFTGRCGAESGWVPVTAPSPTIFVTKIETQRSNQKKNIPTALPQPEFCKDSSINDINKGEEGKLIFKALEDEMARTKDSLKMDGDPLPFFVDYQLNNLKYAYVRASLGGVVACEGNNNLAGRVHLCLGDSMITSQLADSHTGETFGLGFNLDYDHIRKSYWNVSDGIYKICVNHISQKKNRLKQSPLPEEEQVIPERLVMPAREYIEKSCLDNEIDTVRLKKVAAQMSEVFVNYPKLYDNDVNISSYIVDAYRLTSEGVKIRVPNSMTTINVNTKVQAVDGSVIRDEFNVAADEIDALPSPDALIQRTREFCDLLMIKSQAPAVKEYYVGPVMLEDEAVNEAIMRNIVYSMGIAKRDMYRGSSQSSMMLGKRVSDNKLSIYHWTNTPEYNGVHLSGNYRVDADGVTPEKEFSIIEKGILKHLMCGRHPAMGALESTGNERFYSSSLTSATNPGIIYAKIEKGIALSKMKSELIREAKRAGLDHAYIIKAPQYGLRYLVRVDVNTGKEEIVRTQGILVPSKSDLRHIIASSKEEFVANKRESGLVSVITPKAIIVENVEYLFKKPDRAEELQLKNPAER